MACRVCGDLLAVQQELGYVHSDGSIVKQIQVPCANPLLLRTCAGTSCPRCLGTGRIWINGHVVQPVPA